MKVGDASSGHNLNRADNNDRRNRETRRSDRHRDTDSVRLSSEGKRKATRTKKTEAEASSIFRKANSGKPEEEGSKVKAGKTDRAVGNDQDLLRTLEKCGKECENIPDVRSDKVDEARAKLESGEYISEEVVSKIAERLMNKFGL